MSPTQPEIIGLIPAAGRGTRIGPLPCSKEVYPVGFASTDGGRRVPKAVCQYLLEKMRVAGIVKAYVVLREGKWDIPASLGDGATAGMHLAYLMVGISFGVPFTLDQAYPFVRGSLVALGFPDTWFGAHDAFARLLARQTATRADVVLGLFPTDRQEKVDMVDVDKAGRVRRIVIKPRQTDLHYAWGIAVWSPAFTEFLHEYVAVRRESAGQAPELFVGDAVQAAINQGMQVESVQVDDEPFLDIGTPDDLLRATRRLGGVPVPALTPAE